MIWSSVLAKCERESLHAGIEKFDFELAISDWFGLSDQLVESLFNHCTVALLVNINSVRRARRLSIDPHAKFHGRSLGCRTQHEMDIAGVKTIRDASVGPVQRDGSPLHRPGPGQRPLIQAQSRGQRIRARLVQERPAWRRKVPGALIPEIIFRRLEAASIGRLETAGVYRHQFITDTGGAGFSQQTLNKHLRLFV